MINKKFGLLLAAGMLSLSACGEQEQPLAENEEEVAIEEQEDTTEEGVNTEAVEDPEKETQVEPAEETSEENISVEEPSEEDPPEAMSGTASKLLSNGEVTSFIFNETGEFSIFCEPHPVMQMTVQVEEGAEQTDEVSIDIADYEFGEKTITVAPGTIVVWTNQDQVQHNVAIK